MKVRRLFSCLLLCVLICSAVFSHSATATTVNGYDVVTAYSTDGKSYNAFVTSVVTDYWYDTLYVKSTINFPSAIKSGTVFNMLVEVDHSPCGSITAECNLYDATDYLLGTENVIVQDGFLSLREVLVANGDLSYIVINFIVTEPIFQENTIYEPYYFTVNGTEYSCLEGMDWATFIESSYNDGSIYSDDGGVVCSTLSKGYVYQNGKEVYEDYYIQNNASYWLTTDNTIYSPSKSFMYFGYYSNKLIYDGTFYYLDGMTWAEWVNSDYNTDNWFVMGSNIHTGNSDLGYVCKRTANGVFYVNPTDVIDASIFGSYNYWASIATSNLLSTEYVFNLTVVSIEVVEYDEGQLQGGILGWIKNIFNSIKDLPNKISGSIKGFFDNIVQGLKDLGNFIIDGIKGLFIPDEAELTAYKDKWMSLLEDRFGVLFESMTLIDQWSEAFQYNSTKETITFPTVNVPLAGANFSFGGWEVDIVPDRFEFVLDSCKLIINIVCTLAFINALRKRLEEILG